MLGQLSSQLIAGIGKYLSGKDLKSAVQVNRLFHASLCDDVLYKRAVQTGHHEALFWTVMHGYKGAALRLINQGADINRCSLTKRKYPAGNIAPRNLKEVRIAPPQTVLHVAAELNNLEACRLALKLGADPTRRDWEGKRPLSMACEMACEELIITISKAIPNISETCSIPIDRDFPMNMLHWAVFRGLPNVLRFYIDIGYDIRQVTGHKVPWTIWNIFNHRSLDQSSGCYATEEGRSEIAWILATAEEDSDADWKASLKGWNVLRYKHLMFLEKARAGLTNSSSLFRF